MHDARVVTKLTFTLQFAEMTYDCSAACKCQPMLPSDRSLLRDAVIFSIASSFRYPRRVQDIQGDLDLPNHL